MDRLVEEIGDFQLRLERNHFRALVRSIIWQQISGAAASSIYRRLLVALAPARLNSANLSNLTVEQLREAGISPQKARYLLDLAKKVNSDEVRLNRLRNASDAAVIEQLTRITGIGVWTAQMFLIFSLGRLDVFPHDDLGIRQALQRAYRLNGLPDRETSRKIAAPWQPFSTIASWYCWRSLELKT
jgi:DNA-3-methyladenine glycosylase II